MTKRKKFIIVSLLLSFGFIGLQFLPDSFRFISIGILGLLTVIFFIIALWDGLGRDMTLAVLILPFYFTLGVGLFWFLLPSNMFTRIPIAFLYGSGIYALCLTANIYTVAAIRTIALMRAARGVGFVLTLLTFFLIFDTILSLRLPVYFSGISTTFLSFPLYLQGFWAISLERHLTKDIVVISIVCSLVAGEIATALFFWPVSVAVGSLFLTVSSYLLLGLGQSNLEGRLFPQTVREYLVLGLLVFIGMFLATTWAP